MPDGPGKRGDHGGARDASPSRAGTPCRRKANGWPSMRAGLRREASPDRPYSLDIVLADPQTLQIIVHHAATMDRAQVKNVPRPRRTRSENTARSYGWDKWVKIRETVDSYAVKNGDDSDDPDGSPMISMICAGVRSAPG